MSLAWIAPDGTVFTFPAGHVHIRGTHGDLAYSATLGVGVGPSYIWNAFVSDLAYAPGAWTSTWYAPSQAAMAAALAAMPPPAESLQDAYVFGRAITGAHGHATAVQIGAAIGPWEMWSDGTLAVLLANNAGMGGAGAQLGYNLYYDVAGPGWVQPDILAHGVAMTTLTGGGGLWGWADNFATAGAITGGLLRYYDGTDFYIKCFNFGIGLTPALKLWPQGDLVLAPATAVVDFNAAFARNAKDPVNPQDLVTLSYAGAHYETLSDAAHRIKDDGTIAMLNNTYLAWVDSTGFLHLPVVKLNASDIIEIGREVQFNGQLDLNDQNVAVKTTGTSSIGNGTHALLAVNARNVFSDTILALYSDSYVQIWDAFTGMVPMPLHAGDVRAYETAAVKYASLAHDGTNGNVSTSAGNLVLSHAANKYITAANVRVIDNATAWESYAFVDGDVILLGSFVSGNAVNINKQVTLIGPGAGKCTIKCSNIAQYVAISDVTIVPGVAGCTFGNCNSYYGVDFAAGTFTFSGDTNSVFDNCSFAGAVLNFVYATLTNCLFTATTLALTIGSYCAVENCGFSNMLAGASPIVVSGSYSTISGLYAQNPAWPTPSLLTLLVSGSYNTFNNCLVQRLYAVGAADLLATVSGSYNVFNGCAFLEEDLANNAHLIRALLVSGASNAFNGCSFTASPQAGVNGWCLAAEVSGNYDTFNSCHFDANNGGAANSLGLQVDGGATNTQVTSCSCNATATYTDAGTGTVVIGGTIAVSQQIISSLATGTAPLSVASTTMNTNLNADMVDGYHLPGAFLANPLPNNTYIQWVNAAGKANLNVIALNASNIIELAQPTLVDGELDVGGQLNVGNGTTGENAQVYATFGANTAPVMDAGHWTAGADWTFAGGVATHAATGSSTLSPTVSLAPTIGITYQVVFTLAGYSAGSVTMTLGGIVGAIQAFNGTYTVRVTAATTGNLIFTPTATFIGGISAVTMEAVTAGIVTVGGDVDFTDIYGNTGSLGTLAGRLRQMKNNCLLSTSQDSLSCAGGVLTYTLTAGGGTVGFDLGDIVYPVTTGTYSVALTGGTDANPVTNYVYFILGPGNVPTITCATSYPTNLNFVTIATFVVGAVAGANYTIYGYNRNRDEADTFVNHVANRFYNMGTLYVSGYVPTVAAGALSIAAAGSFFNGILQMFSNNAVSMAGGYTWIDSAGAYHASVSIGDLTQYADGSAVPANGRVNVVWGVVPTTTVTAGVPNTVVKLFAVLMSPPGSTYTTNVACEQDVYAVTNYYPPDPILQKVFVPVCRTIVRPSVPSFNPFSSGAYFKDERGKIVSGGGSATPVDLSGLIPKNVLVAQGDLIYASAAATPTNLTAGVKGQPLLTQGAAANPIWSPNTYHFTAAADWEAYTPADGDVVILGKFTSANAVALNKQITIIGAGAGVTLIKCSAIGNYVSMSYVTMTGSGPCTFGVGLTFVGCDFAGTCTFTGATNSVFENCSFGNATCSFISATLNMCAFTAATCAITVGNSCSLNACSTASIASVAVSLTISGNNSRVSGFTSFNDGATASVFTVTLNGLYNVLENCQFALRRSSAAAIYLVTVSGNNNTLIGCTTQAVNTGIVLNDNAVGIVILNGESTTIIGGYDNTNVSSLLTYTTGIEVNANYALIQGCHFVQGTNTQHRCILICPGATSTRLVGNWYDVSGGATGVTDSGTDTLSLATGTAAGTVCAGNDTRLPPAPSAQGNLIYDTGAAYATLAVGTSGYILATQGAGANPHWIAYSPGQFFTVEPYTSFAVSFSEAASNSSSFNLNWSTKTYTLEGGTAVSVNNMASLSPPAGTIKAVVLEVQANPGTMNSDNYISVFANSGRTILSGKVVCQNQYFLICDNMTAACTSSTSWFTIINTAGNGSYYVYVVGYWT